MPKSNLSAKIKQQVAKRANSLCEYCLANAEYAYHTFPIDHILPVSLGGTNALELTEFENMLLKGLEKDERIKVQKKAL